MVDVIRYAEKFESTDAATTQTFPDSNTVYTPSQSYREAWAPAAGADYGHDYAGYGRWAKEVGTEEVRGMIWGSSGSNADSQFDALASKLASIGLGKLFVIDNAGSRRWCYAKLAARPGYQTDPNSLYNIPYVLRFLRFSDWFDTSLVSASSAVSANYESFVVNNTGNAYVKTGFVIQLTATAAVGFSNVIITNVTTGEIIRWNNSARWSGAVLRIDNSDLSVKLLPDPGLVVGDSTSFTGEAGVGGPGVYVDAYPSAQLGSKQSGFITLKPGNNTIVIQVDGTAAYTRYHEFYPAWE